jgi:hypothetical protein
LQRFRQLAAIQDVVAQRGDLGYVIDTTTLDARQVAQAIWDARPVMNILQQVLKS